MGDGTRRRPLATPPSADPARRGRPIGPGFLETPRGSGPGGDPGGVRVRAGRAPCRPLLRADHRDPRDPPGMVAAGWRTEDPIAPRPGSERSGALEPFRCPDPTALRNRSEGASRRKPAETGLMTYRRTLLCAALLAIGLGCSARSERAADPGNGPRDSTSPGAGVSECSSNAEIVQLVGRGEQDDAIIARITRSATCFDVSAAEIVTLRNAGVSPAVITAMSGRPGRRPTERGREQSLRAAAKDRR